MRKLRISAALAVAALIGSWLASCGGSAEGPATLEGRPTFAFVTNMPHAFWEMAQAGVLQASRDLEVNVQFHQPDGTVPGQKQKLEDVMLLGVDGIAVSVLQPDAQTEFLNEVAAQVPLVTHDADAPESARRCFIGVDNYVAGRKLGELVRARLPEGGKVAIFVGNLTQSNAVDRRQGVLDAMFGRATRPEAMDPPNEAVAGGGFEVVGTYTDEGDDPVAKQRVEDALSRHPDLDAIIGLFQHNAPQALAALRDNGRLGEVMVFSFDEHADVLAAIEEGHCEGTVVQDPYSYGYRAIETLLKIHEGAADAVPEGKIIDIEPELVTADGLEEFRAGLAKKAAILEAK